MKLWKSILLFLSVFTSASYAQTVYNVESGSTSVSLHKNFLANAGLSLTNFVSPGSTAPGFDGSFDISSSSDFSFKMEPAFTPVEGRLFHSGSIVLDQGSLGSFAINQIQLAYGVVAPGKFEVFDGILTGTRWFELGTPAATTLNGNDFAFGNADLIVTNEFATFLQNSSLAGDVAGQIRVDALVSAPVPEPQSAVLATIGLAMVSLRRRRR